MDVLDEQAAACLLFDRWSTRAARRGHPLWFQLAVGDDGNLATRQVTAPEGLVGRVVGPRWCGVAVVATGRFRLLDESHEPPAAMIPGFAGGLALACVLSRSARVGWRLRLPDGSFYDAVPEEGFMMDVLRRSLSLATPPPPESTRGLQLAAWMSAMVSVASEQTRRLGWEESLRLHPALVDRALIHPEEAELALAGDADGASAEARSAAWDLMRRLAGAGVESEILPPADLADWMDAGMFARWVMGRLPDVAGFDSALRESLEPYAYRRVSHLVRKLETGVKAR